MHELDQFFREVENRGTQTEQDLWLVLKPFFKVYQNIDEETGEKYETFDISDEYYSSMNFESEHGELKEFEYFRSHLLFEYIGSDLEYASDSVKDILENINPQPYGDMEFRVYRFDKLNGDKFGLIVRYFLFCGNRFTVNSDKNIYDAYQDVVNKFKNKSQDLLTCFMSGWNNLSQNNRFLLGNKKNEWEEFTDIVLLEDDGNTYHVLFENSDYFYFFEWLSS